jgi:serine/threonine-protein kinase
LTWADKTADDGSADTAPVGSYLSGASWVGAFDLAGNVCEWVQDWNGLYTTESQTNPTGPDSGNSRVWRGGSWGDEASFARVSFRGWYAPADRYGDQGFRCVVRLP